MFDPFRKSVLNVTKIPFLAIKRNINNDISHLSFFTQNVALQFKYFKNVEGYGGLFSNLHLVCLC